MARLNQLVDSDDEFPELSTLFRQRKSGDGHFSERPYKRRDGNEKSPRKTESAYMPKVAGRSYVPLGGVAPKSSDDKHCSKLAPLKPADIIESQYLPTLRNVLDDETVRSRVESCARTSPRIAAKSQADYSKLAPRLSDASLSSRSEDGSFTDLSGFIVPDSASDEDVLPSKSQRNQGFCKVSSKPGDQQSKKYASIRGRPLLEGHVSPGTMGLTPPAMKRLPMRPTCAESPPRFKTLLKIANWYSQDSDLEEPFSELSLYPASSKSPCKRNDGSHFVTPQSSPSKPKLQNPARSHRIPPSPHRPSIDAFWSADVINDWNEQYSPKKALRSSRKMRLHSVEEDDDDLSPSESPRKGPIKSPAKRNTKLADRRKAFDDTKQQIAAVFLAEVDSAVGEGQVAAMAESTGGIKIVWSKKLSSTAGRANWRREAVRSKSSDGIVSTTSHRHHASIELAEKVIDDEDRLTNVIAHEYCHLANFMISGVKNNPHGASFKSWAAKATQAFRDRNINVTTKHTYEIAYKYIWTCSAEACGLEYKRHSKSIDPAKHSCGSCKSQLIQIQPTPRKAPANGAGKKSEFQKFVKRERDEVRARNPGATFGEMMTILGRKYRESKKSDVLSNGIEERPEMVVDNAGATGDDVDNMATKLTSLDLEG